MDFIIAFVLMVAAMLASIPAGISMLAPLGVGLIAFSIVAMRRGHALPAVIRMAAQGAWASRVVIVTMLLIGCLTSLWRQCGTIAYFTAYGIRLMSPRVFVLAAFLLTSIVSYALGTSFGVVSTIGVILMTIARASGVSPVFAGGAILSGLYVGDRAAPASSCASLVASQTGTDVTQNIRKMIRPSLLPIGLCIALYGALSLLSAPESMDTSLLERFDMEYTLNAWCLLPTLLLLVLAFAGLKIKYVMAIDIAVSMAIAVFLQRIPAPEMLRMTIAGFAPRDKYLSNILSGGGVVSMVNISLILLLSNAVGGIFEGAKLLAPVEGLIARLAKRIGRFGAMIMTSVCACAVFCNQTIGIVMCRQCMHNSYGDSPDERNAMMLDIANSVTVIAALIPWCIACSVPITAMGCGLGAVPFAAYLYLLPLCWLIRTRRARSA